MGLRWRLRVVYWWASPFLRPFQPIFGLKFGWITWPVNRGSPITPYLNFLNPICLFTIQPGPTMTIKGSFHRSIPIVKAFLTRNARQKLTKKLRFEEKMGSKCKMLFSWLPIHLRETMSFNVYIVKIGAGVLAVGCPRTKTKLAESLDAHFRIFGGGKGSSSYRDEILRRGRGFRRNHSC